MLALRYASALALVVWVGGLLAIGAIAAPSAFDILTARSATDGRLLAAAVVGETLRRFHHLAYVCAAVLLGSLTMRAILGPRPRRYGLRVTVGSLMLLASLYSALVVGPRIERATRGIAAPPSSLPDTDPRRVAFGRLHATSTGLAAVPLLGGLLLLFWELKD